MQHLYKKTSTTLLPISVRYANSFASRFLGLMLQKSLPDHEALLLSPCNSIHMFFMRFSIDAIFVDKQDNVVNIVEDLKPWKVVLPIPQAYSTLELPSGMVNHYGIAIGDKLKVQSAGGILQIKPPFLPA